MKPFKHQEAIARDAVKILRSKGLVYLAMEERTGKTLTSIRTYELSKASDVLVLTTKKALKGWHDTLSKYGKCISHGAVSVYTVQDTKFTVVNYHSIHKLDRLSFDAGVCDEAHTLATYPKPGKIWRRVHKAFSKLPVIFLSATPSAQSLSQLYHQLKLSSYSPWRAYSTFYKWFKEYGIPETIFIAGRPVHKYDNTHETRIREEIKPYFITYTRADLGFKQEPKDHTFYVELEESTKALYRELEKNEVILVGNDTVIADSSMSLRTKLHQIIGGTLKYENTTYILGNTEKIDAIKEKFGDTDNLVIMYNYKKELNLLKKHFKHAHILQGTSFAEGVDLSDIRYMVVYSMNFSTAKYTQRRARQANIDRKDPIDVWYPLVKGGIDEQVYQTVAINRVNFVDKYYERGTLE